MVLTQCVTRMLAETGATLTAAVNATVWEQGISTRLVLFKNWIWREGQPISVCLAGIQKHESKASHDAVEHVSAFKIENVGCLADAQSRRLLTIVR